MQGVFLKSSFGLGTMVMVSILAVFVPVMGAEFALRLFPSLSVERGPVSLRVRQALPGLRQEILYERDAFGLRTLSLDPARKPPGAVRILCIGASTTDQPTQDTADTWCSLLQVSLTERFSGLGFVIETATLAQGGWRVPDLIARMNDQVGTLQPDIVVILMGINDLAFNGGPGYLYTGLPDRLTSIAAHHAEIKTGFWGRCETISHLCHRMFLLRKAFQEWRLRREGRLLEWHSQNLPILRREYQQYPNVEWPRREPDPLQEFEDGTEALLTMLVNRGIDAVVLGQPVLWKESMSESERAALWFYVETPEGRVRPSGRWLVAEMTRYNAAQHTIAQKYGVRYLDLDTRIPKDLDHYFDDCHFTDLGSRRMADEILPHVAAIVQSRHASHSTSWPHVDSLPVH